MGFRGWLLLINFVIGLITAIVLYDQILSKMNNGKITVDNVTSIIMTIVFGIPTAILVAYLLSKVHGDKVVLDLNKDKNKE